jgi:branched-chain amino acid transport system ATP-binding protein
VSLLRIVDIHTYYGKSYILQGASLEVRSGEIVALLGRNGAGKTTTLKTIMGLVKPKAGKVFFKDADITPFPAFKIARKGIGYVPQSRQLFPKMTVLENLKTGTTGLGDESRKEQLAGVFSLFPVLEARLGQLAGTLSGGEQQALAISRALVTRPEILLLDEPTTGLMPIFVSKLKEIIKKLNDDGISMLLVEEKIPFALSVAHRVSFMVKGKIEYDADKQEVQNRKEILIRYLGVEV